MKHLDTFTPDDTTQIIITQLYLDSVTDFLPLSEKIHIYRNRNQTMETMENKLKHKGLCKCLHQMRGNHQSICLTRLGRFMDWIVSTSAGEAVIWVLIRRDCIKNQNSFVRKVEMWNIADQMWLSCKYESFPLVSNEKGQRNDNRGATRGECSTLVCRAKHAGVYLTPRGSSSNSYISGWLVSS